ncbi:hypothetical protein HPB52_013353 [Rhipicephalus sanguineus]|uniref:Uncharacterized protein n=1 Tax=Rhipicephalus sanguineus TaxID=34632 RepID=A0A9D4PDT8_RHISA|nr:hypothetical protein HPB52_013353 [Rhipicephalus sanguineus]
MAILILWHDSTLTRRPSWGTLCRRVLHGAVNTFVKSKFWGSPSDFLGAMSSAASGGPLMSSYYSDLIGSARIRYEEKVQMCDGIDPYTVRPHADTTTDVNTVPEVTHGDIVNYLVYSSSFATLQEMKAFKSLEAHNYFTSGWVKSLSTKRLQEGKVVRLGEVNATPTHYG